MSAGELHRNPAALPGVPRKELPRPRGQSTRLRRRQTDHQRGLQHRPEVLLVVLRRAHADGPAAPAAAQLPAAVDDVRAEPVRRAVAAADRDRHDKLAELLEAGQGHMHAVPGARPVVPRGVPVRHALAGEPAVRAAGADGGPEDHHPEAARAEVCAAGPREHVPVRPDQVGHAQVCAGNRKGPVRGRLLVRALGRRESLRDQVCCSAG